MIDQQKLAPEHQKHYKTNGFQQKWYPGHQNIIKPMLFQQQLYPGHQKPYKTNVFSTSLAFLLKKHWFYKLFWFPATIFVEKALVS